MSETIESWRKVFRDGFAPLCSTEGLEAIHEALRTNDKRLIRGSTTQPPPLTTTEGWPVEACCLVAYSGWQGDKLETVGEVETYFARMCCEIDNRLGEPAACRWLLNAFDGDAHEAKDYWAGLRRELMAECKLALEARKAS